MNMKKATLLFPLVLSACFPVVLPVVNPSDQAPNIYGTWRLQEVYSKAPKDEDAVFTINSSDHGFSAVSACHKVSGRYVTADQQSFTVRGLKSDAQCGANEPEAKLTDALAKVRHYRFVDRDLELLNEKGDVILMGKRLLTERTHSQADEDKTAYLQDARRN